MTPDTKTEILNKQSKALRFTMTYENNSHITFLDLYIINTQDNIEKDIYRKPETTDIIINKQSYHPGGQKMATFKSLIHRLHNLHLNNTNRSKKFTSRLP